MTRTVPAANIRLKRAYDPVEPADGSRILVDRLWPRGVSKDAAHLDGWIKEIAPRAELGTWFGHDPERWGEFRRRYRAELRGHAETLTQLRRRTREGPLTLVYSAKDEKHNDAIVLRNVLIGRTAPHKEKE